MSNKDGISIERDEVILTERCRLRFPLVSDIPHIWSATRTIGFNDGLRWNAPERIEDIEGPFQELLAAWGTGEEYSWAIDTKDNKDFVGWISVRREQEDKTWSLGYWVHPSKQRNGYATECANALVKFCFTRLSADRVTAAHATWNHASGKVLTGIGMTRIGTNPKGFEKNGEWVEEFEYAIHRV